MSDTLRMCIFPANHVSVSFLTKEKGVDQVGIAHGNVNAFYRFLAGCNRLGNVAFGA
jgi:hypothetical protein